MKKPTPNWEQLPDFAPGNVDGLRSNSPDVDKGYDIEAVRRNPQRTAEILATCNGALCNEHTRVRFFVNAVVVSVGMANTRAQGRRIQDLYPQAFKMPTYIIKAQSLTQEDYGLLCEFVHASQQDAVGSGKLLKLWIKEGVPYQKNGEWFTGGIAGHHKPIEAEGFVVRMPRKHERFVYTPKYDFEFSVVHSDVGIFSSQLQPVSAKELMNPEITEIIGKQESPFSQAPKATPASEPTAKGLTGSSGPEEKTTTKKPPLNLATVTEGKEHASPKPKPGRKQREAKLEVEGE